MPQYQVRPNVLQFRITGGRVLKAGDTFEESEAFHERNHQSVIRIPDEISTEPVIPTEVEPEPAPVELAADVPEPEPESGDDDDDEVDKPDAPKKTRKKPRR